MSIFGPCLRRCRRAVLALFLSVFAVASAQAADTYQIVHTYPHDQQAYTQGLIYLDGYLYESTGLNGHSSLRKEDLETGRILQFQDVPAQYFAEGLTAWTSGATSTLIQLTWQHHIALVYDRATFRFLRTLPYTGEGWGLTEDGKSLILSDGTSTLRFLDPTTFQELRRVTVTEYKSKGHGTPVTQLNELEYIHGQVYANVWHTDRIARIAPTTGQVLGWIDLAGLLAPNERSDPEAVLNGIAYDAAHDRLFVTGKLWPKLFEIKVVPAQPKIVPIQRAK
jgi:glutamine cyclotransferase